MKSLVYVAAAVGADIRRQTVPRITLAVAVAYGLASAACEFLKERVDRARPDAARALIEPPTTDSFPSGHATTAFAAAVALTVLVPRAGWWALPLAALVAYSRVHLGAHYWTDILAGALLGAAVGAAVAVPVALRRRR